MSTPPPPPGLLEVGRIGKPHGVRGDVFLTLTSDVDERHEPGAVFTIVEGRAYRELTISKSRMQNGRWVVHFEGVDDRNEVEKLTNKFLYAAPVEDDDALWVHELIGSQVIGVDGSVWGECTGVLHNPAHDLLEIDGRLLVPMPFVKSYADGVTTIDPPDGLREALLASDDERDVK